jgi:magnesium chelatase family protein
MLFHSCFLHACPCGYYGYQLKECRCSQNQIRNYLNRVSGPLLDRIDIHIDIEPIKFEDINSDREEETSEMIRTRVMNAKKIQEKRFSGESISFNSQMKPKHLKKYCRLDKCSLTLIESAFKTMSLSTRAYSKILKVARTIADLDNSSNVEERHVAEAIQYRVLDRKYWG